MRRWQRQALERFEVHPERDFLAIATPGAGKTTFALVAARRALARRRAPRLGFESGCGAALADRRLRLA